MSTPTPLDLDAIRRDAARALTVWQQIQNARRPGMVTDYLLFVEQSAEDVPPLVRYVTTLLGEVERVTRERDAARAEMLARGEAIAQWQHVACQHQAALLAARAEVERLRPVVDAVRRAADEYEGHRAELPQDVVCCPGCDIASDLAAAVAALDTDAPDGECMCEAYDCAGECCGIGRCSCTPAPVPAEGARLRRLEQVARLWHTASSDPAIIGDRGRARVALMLRQAVEDLDDEPIDRAAAEDALMAALYGRRSDAADAEGGEPR